MIKLFMKSSLSFQMLFCEKIPSVAEYFILFLKKGIYSTFRNLMSQFIFHAFYSLKHIIYIHQKAGNYKKSDRV